MPDFKDAQRKQNLWSETAELLLTLPPLWDTGTLASPPMGVPALRVLGRGCAVHHLHYPHGCSLFCASQVPLQSPKLCFSHKINLMPLGVFLVLGLPWCLCVSVPCTSCPLQVFKKNSSSCSPSSPAHLGAVYVEGAGYSLCFFCRMSLGLCQGQKLGQMDFATIQSGTYCLLTSHGI